MKKYLFISIKEQYSECILNGTKKIELRKSRPNVSAGDYLIIYCTSPVKAIVGVAQIERIIEHSPNRMWRLHSKKLGIDRQDYLKYYANTEKAIGIVLSDPRKLSFTICLSLIKEQIPKFSPPQTYRYFHDFTLLENARQFKLTPF